MESPCPQRRQKTRKNLELEIERNALMNGRKIRSKDSSEVNLIRINRELPLRMILKDLSPDF